MHAMVLKKLRERLEWTELPDRLPGPGEVPQMGIVTTTTRYPLQQANQALSDLAGGKFEGAAVLVP
jgi:alcohol dehydrogenase, propanol-preferring